MKIGVRDEDNILGRLILINFPIRPPPQRQLKQQTQYITQSLRAEDQCINNCLDLINNIKICKCQMNRQPCLIPICATHIMCLQTKLTSENKGAKLGIDVSNKDLVFDCKLTSPE